MMAARGASASARAGAPRGIVVVVSRKSVRVRASAGGGDGDKPELISASDKARFDKMMDDLKVRVRVVGGCGVGGGVGFW